MFNSRIPAGATVLGLAAFLARPLDAAEAVGHLAVTVTVAPRCTVRTTGDPADPIWVSCTRGTGATITISALETTGLEAFATQNSEVLVATINF